MDRTILHCDCNGFYASVECVHNPRLKEVPMAVCGDPENRRGIILAKNELAKRQGVTTAETIWQAKKKCPELVLVPPHREEYLRYSKAVNAIYAQVTDQVEPFGIDESWLDVTGSRQLCGDGRQIADDLRRRIREELGLTISVGVSFNKIYAKLGSDYRKPDATTVIDRSNYKDIVYPLPVTDLLFVGQSAATVLRGLYIRTIGDLARADRAMVAARLGKIGGMLHDYAAGLDDSPVRRAEEQREIKSVGNGLTFSRNLEGWEDIRLGLTILADEVAGRLRRQGLLCRTVQVTIKDPDLKSITRQRPLPRPTNLARELAEACFAMMQACWSEKAPVRMLTVTAQQLTEEDGGEQLSLFEPEAAEKHEKRARLEEAVDAIRGKFGRGAILPGAVIGNDIGVDVGGVESTEDFEGEEPRLPHF